MQVTGAIDAPAPYVAEADAPIARYHLRPLTRGLLTAAFAAGTAAFLIAAYVLFPFIGGPNDEALWWRANAAFVVLSCVIGLGALYLTWQDHLRAQPAAAERLRAWRAYAAGATGGCLLSYVLLLFVLSPGAPIWYAYSADIAACALALLALGACYNAPIGHWWELLYSMGLLLLLVGGYAYWFPAIDSFFVVLLFGVIIFKWAKSALRRGMPRIRIEGGLIHWLFAFRRAPKRRPARQHELLYTLALLAGAAPLAFMAVLRPYFTFWREEGDLEVFGYAMLAGTTSIYTAPLVAAAALLFWCRKYQTLTPEEREHHFVRREHLSLVFFGLASYTAIYGYYSGQIVKGPIAYLTVAIAAVGAILALGSRRRLLLFAVVLPIAIAVSLKKLSYIGDFLLPLYVGMPLGF
jgi:hypothetical protein